jgi:iron uptake system component EfeO
MKPLRSAPVILALAALLTACSSGPSAGGSAARSGASSAPGGSVASAAAAATAAYQAYVISEVEQLIAANRTFTDAVRAGDVAKAKASFAAARYHYETIEPVAESFGDLDPQIDARIDDVDDAATWTGFHRLEKALWVDNTTKGTQGLADKLDADIAKLHALVADETYQPAQLANGATGLLDEVAKSKVTGEEDRYSHTDLSDFAANVAGSYQAFRLLQPLLAAKDPDLAATVDARFQDVQASLAEHKRGEQWAPYTTVNDSTRRTLAQQVDALAEPLSQVAAVVV